MSHTNRPAPELGAVEVHGVTRSAFILRAALAAGSVYGVGTVAPFVGQAMAQGQGDVEILNFALTLEHLETEFYRGASGLSGDAATAAKAFGDDEAEHVEALTKTIRQLGGKAAVKPTFSFPRGDQPAFLKLAQTLEDTGVAAYNGAGPMIRSREVLAAAGSIVQVEARHAAAIRMIADQPPSPEPFDKGMAMEQVLGAVKPFIRS